MRRTTHEIALKYPSYYLNDHEKTAISFKAISFKHVRNKLPNRFYFITNEFNQLKSYFNVIAKDIYHALAMTFSLDAIDFHNFKRFLWPIFTSGVALLVGNYATQQMSEFYFETDQYDFLFKLTLGLSILSYCMLHRITEKPLSSIFETASAVSMEVVSIIYLYTSVFNGSRMLFDGLLSENYSLIASLGLSTIFVPGLLSHIAETVQTTLLKRLYAKGAQRVDTAFLTSGLTSISNTYLQLNHFIISELLTGSRLFQLGLISDNIFHTQKVVQRFRNLPALLTDIGPAVLKKLVSQQEKIAHDRQHNTALQNVLRFTKTGTKFVSIPRYQLRTGDLVWCDPTINLDSFPLSGEIFFLQKDANDQFTTSIEHNKFSVNLKAHNGEDNWIEFNSNTSFTTPHTHIDLHSLHKGKQAGILAGAKLNIYGAQNCFIQIKPEKKYNFFSHYEKKSVINQIINERKQKNVLFAMLASIIMASFLKQDIASIPNTSISLLFNLFQTMIPFSEAFLREMINSRLLQKLNDKLQHIPLEPIDALRIVDLCNALGGYYHDKFPKGVAIVSDKTGTLTTPHMEMLGCWTDNMQENVQSLLAESPSHLYPISDNSQAFFEVFASAYTNEKKEVEPEEHAILSFLLSLNDKKNNLKITTVGNHHFKKTLVVDDATKEIETFHLGLYRSLGGRLTLVIDNDQRYLIFCGIPKYEKMRDTAVYDSYHRMQARKGVLSRDWCVARHMICEQDFQVLKELFLDDKKIDIEEYLLRNFSLISGLRHICTFIINNPIKKNAEHFISQCQSVGVPVFVATGDTIRAAENIASVLCGSATKEIITIRATEANHVNFDAVTKNKTLANTTLIFGGINDKILTNFKQILQFNIDERPVIIFAEMTTEEKGMLSQFLSDQQYFVLANGDGSNDVMMMRNANLVITHLNDDATHAPGVEQFSNLSDRQLEQLSGTNQSFYELFDIHEPNSHFLKTFIPFANSQEKSTMALTMKNSKMSFEIAKSAGLPNVTEMAHQHWYSVAFDLIWLCISFQMINTSTDLPADHQHLNMSNFINQCLVITTGLAFLQAFTIYFLTGESTNLSAMLLMLCFLPVVLKSIFSAYSEVQNEVHPSRQQQQAENRTSFLKSISSYVGSFFHAPAPKPVKVLTRRHQPVKNELSPT